MHLMSFAAHNAIYLLRHNLLIQMLHKGAYSFAGEDTQLVDIKERPSLIVGGNRVLSNLQTGQDLR